MMHLLYRWLFFFMLLGWQYNARALLSLELTKGVARPVPIALLPIPEQRILLNNNLMTIVANDLQNSGHFNVFSETNTNAMPPIVSAGNSAFFKKLDVNHVVESKLTQSVNGQFNLEIKLIDVYADKNTMVSLAHRTYRFKATEQRLVAHRISDFIYEQLTGTRGVFATKLAYVVVNHSTVGSRYYLAISDQDGFDQRVLLQSPEPIMSPAWSPTGLDLAYVSFEKKHASIYIQNIATGARHAVSDYVGINGAPAWSPDGHKLALVLSKSGSLNIYILDLNTLKLRQLTHDFYLNTEPAWSPDGKNILFTSNRGGNPQLYELNINSLIAKRLTFDGNYNARGSYQRDGNAIVMLHQVGGIYHITQLNLKTGRLTILTDGSADCTSPTAAPNGSMVLFDTNSGNQTLLGMVSIDGKIILHLPARDGDAQDPAWSPYLHARI